MVLTRDGGIVSLHVPMHILSNATNSFLIDRPFLTTHSGRWRFMQVIMISVFGQWSGNGLGYFNTTIFSTLGYKSSSTQLLLNIVNSLVSAIGALSAVCFTDRMPRRPVLIWGTFGGFFFSHPAAKHACFIQ
jgi:hypothetical protein